MNRILTLLSFLTWSTAASGQTAILSKESCRASDIFEGVIMATKREHSSTLSVLTAYDLDRVPVVFIQADSHWEIWAQYPGAYCLVSVGDGRFNPGLPNGQGR